MPKNIISLLLILFFTSSQLYASSLEVPADQKKKESNPVVDNSAEEVNLLEATDSQLDYAGINIKGNKEVLSGAYDDTELRRAVIQNKKGIEAILSKLTEKKDGWTETTLPDGTKIRTNPNGDIEVWDPITGKWVPLNKLSKEEQDRILNEMLKKGLITPDELEKIKQKLENSDWTETTLPDGTKIRTNPNGDIEVWDPITGKWVPLNKLSKEEQDRILNEMLKKGLITPDELEKIKKKLQNSDWTETTLPDGTKIRTNPNGDIEVWDPITGKWVPLNKLSKEEQDRILNEMLKKGLITPDEMKKIKDKLAAERADNLRKAMRAVGILDTTDWNDLTDEQKAKVLKKLQDMANEKNKDNNKADSSKSPNKKGLITYYDEEGNKRTYDPNKENNNDNKSPKDNNSNIPAPLGPSLEGIQLEEAVDVLAMINKNIENVKLDGSQATKKVTDAQKFPLFEAALASNQLAIDEANAKKADVASVTKIMAECDLPIQKDVRSAKESLETYCSSEKLGSFILISELSFETKDNIPELVATAKDLSFSITGYDNPNNLVIKESLIINAYTSNRNIATVVNMRRIEKYLAKTGKETFDLVKGGVDKYTEALSASLEETSTQTNATTGTETVSSNSKTPELMNFLTPVGVQVAMAFIGNGLEVIFSDSPIVASVYKNTKLKVYLTLEGNTNAK